MYYCIIAGNALLCSAPTLALSSPARTIRLLVLAAPRAFVRNRARGLHTEPKFNADEHNGIVCGSGPTGPAGRLEVS